MSLINDALKKAARQRAEEQGEVIPPMPGGGRRRVSRQGEPMKTQTLVLIIAAAVALVVVSVVVTGVLMNSKPEAKPALAAKPPAETPAPQPAAKVVIQAPIIAVAVPTPTPAVAAMPTPAPSPAAAAPVVEAAPAPTAAPVATATAATPQSHIDAVQAVVDGFHISGVRTAGAGSKALVDGHVYKLNDVIDKTVGLKLVKVDEDHLTFVDRDGNSYVRNF
jgi:hypothetical protein